MYELSLDKEQLEAVEFSSSQLIEAGPGSGKTRMLTEKARRLMKEKKSIICLCFTRAAASEMASRVPRLPATTIHSYCYGNVGWTKDKSMEAFGGGYEDLLWRFIHTEDKPKFDWVLCDEVQDLSELELEVVGSLVGEYLFSVGDKFQSIYGFQRAMGSRAFKVLKEWGCKEFKLHNNYRSSEEIVRRLNLLYPRDLVSKGVKTLGTTAILTRKNEYLRQAHKYLEDLQVPHTVKWSEEQAGKKGRETIYMSGSNLILSTCHSSKGHEYDKVILYRWERPTYGDIEEEERIYYVSVSRASQEFYRANTLEELIKFI